VKRNKFERWLQNIGATQEEEISCSECFDFVSHYVEVEATGGDAAGAMPQLKHHLDQCAACREEYETLRDLRQLEDEGGLPSRDDLEDLIP
jgi:predicted anti-sigma-YlaC factor YlaD